MAYGQNIVPSAGSGRNIAPTRNVGQTSAGAARNYGQYKPAIQNLVPSTRISAAGAYSYYGAGYSPVFAHGDGGVVPQVSPAIDTPSVQAQGTANEPASRQEKRVPLRFDQLWSAHQNPLLIWPKASEWQKQFIPTAPDRWPGPAALLPRLWDTNMGALGGVAQRGFHQDQSRKNGLFHLNPLWALRQLASARAVQQNLNRMAGAVAVPGVFVPTSPANFHRGRGSY
jgi:hypothetical protein